MLSSGVIIMITLPIETPLLHVPQSGRVGGAIHQQSELSQSGRFRAAGDWSI